jgi:hypothetical protein
MSRKWTSEEDKILKEFGCVKTSVELSQILDRTPKAILHRLHKLGMKWRLMGEHHWRAKRSNLLVSMILTLHQSGFTPLEIQKTLQGFDLNINQVSNYCYGARQ